MQSLRSQSLITRGLDYGRIQIAGITVRLHQMHFYLLQGNVKGNVLISDLIWKLNAL